MFYDKRARESKLSTILAIPDSEQLKRGLIHFINEEKELLAQKSNPLLRSPVLDLAERKLNQMNSNRSAPAIAKAIDF
ncbi:hypothetical protein [Fluoribacter gormanii]|uniref:hypothetical protein n=1 Tax=Fluoribacter gormanii TaxID=464 RepID=UPI001040FA39|nr:hypothetical protein [Fluoribacter gormanii]